MQFPLALCREQLTLRGSHDENINQSLTGYGLQKKDMRILLIYCNT
jgi:hypothetical protein